MKRWTTVLLLALSAPAQAQQVPDWSHGACYENGIYFPARPFNQCVSSDKQGFAQTMPPSNLLVGTTGVFTTSPGASVTSAPHSCSDRRELVMRSSGAYGCAADVVDPK